MCNLQNKQALSHNLHPGSHRGDDQAYPQETKVSIVERTKGLDAQFRLRWWCGLFRLWERATHLFSNLSFKLFLFIVYDTDATSSSQLLPLCRQDGVSSCELDQVEWLAPEPG